MSKVLAASNAYVHDTSHLFCLLFASLSILRCGSFLFSLSLSLSIVSVSLLVFPFLTLFFLSRFDNFLSLFLVLSNSLCLWFHMCCSFSPLSFVSVSLSLSSVSFFHLSSFCVVCARSSSFCLVLSFLFVFFVLFHLGVLLFAFYLLVVMF